MAETGAFIFLAFCAVQTEGFKLSAPRFTVMQPAANLTVVFTADVALSACRVTEHNTGQVLDGTVSGAGAPGVVDRCVVTLHARTHPATHYVFSCRARSVDGLWDRAITVVAVMGEAWKLLAVTSTADRLLVTKDALADFRLTSPAHLRVCKLRTRTAVWTSVLLPQQGKITLRNKECAVRLKASEQNNGIVLTQLRTSEPAAIFIHALTLIVKAAPPPPQLDVIGEDDAKQFVAGDELEARCHVGPARPAASVAWLLRRPDAPDAPADALIDAPLDADADAEWAEEFTESAVSRRLLLRLRVEHDGLQLVCRVNHVALPPPGILEDVVVISVSERPVFWTWEIIGGSAGLAGLLLLLASLLVWCCVVKRACFAVKVTGPDVVKVTQPYEEIEFNNVAGGSADADVSSPPDDDIYDDVGPSLAPHRERAGAGIAYQEPQLRAQPSRSWKERAVKYISYVPPLPPKRR